MRLSGNHLQHLNQTAEVAMSQTAPVIFSHWNHLVEGLQTSPKQYYADLEQAISRRGLSSARISRVNWREGGVFSAKREYLRVKRKEFVFDVCGAPYGNGFFFSWWLGQKPSGLLAVVAKIPFLGPLVLWLYHRFIKPETYYQVDTALMFQQSVHAAVMEVIDEMTEAKGLHALSELERKPVSREFFDGIGG